MFITMSTTTSITTSFLLIYSNIKFNWMNIILNIKNINIYSLILFIYLSLMCNHLQGTTYRKNELLVNYKIAGVSKTCIIFILYSMLLNGLNYFSISLNMIALNSLFLLYLPYYLDFAEYTGNRRILMPSFFHDMMYFFYRFIGNYQLINDSIKLEADKNKNTFILGIHPHGLFPFGTVGSLALPNDLKYTEETTPILNTTYLKPGIATLCFYIPIIREIYLWLGAVDCSKPILKNLLNNGYSIAIFPGGAQEAQYSGLGSTKLILKNRNGIFKLALETGSFLIPVYTFGNNNIYNSLNWDIFGIFYLIKKITGIWFPRGYFITKKHDFISVIGKPITVKKLTSDDDIDICVDKLREQYMNSLEELFEKYKYLDKYCENKCLEYM